MIFPLVEDVFSQAIPNLFLPQKVTIHSWCGRYHVAKVCNKSGRSPRMLQAENFHWGIPSSAATSRLFLELRKSRASATARITSLATIPDRFVHVAQSECT